MLLIGLTPNAKSGLKERDTVKQRIWESLSNGETPHLNPPPQGGKKLTYTIAS